MVLSVDAIYTALDNQKRYGVRDHQLFRHGRPLVDLLMPPNHDDHDDTFPVRCVKTEQLIKEAIERLDGPTHRVALNDLLGLSYDGATPTLSERRAAAAEILGIRKSTFRGSKHEKDLLWSLAFEIFELILSRCGETHGNNTVSLTDSVTHSGVPPGDARPREQCQST
jgi:hypothetical protein